MEKKNKLDSLPGCAKIHTKKKFMKLTTTTYAVRKKVEGNGARTYDSRIAIILIVVCANPYRPAR